MEPMIDWLIVEDYQFTLQYFDRKCNIFVVLFAQIAQHHISTAQSLAKMMGWQVLAINTQVGVADMEPVGNAHSIVMASPNGMR